MAPTVALTFVLGIPSHLVTALPYMRECEERGARIHVCCPRAMESIVRAACEGMAADIHDLDELGHPFRLWGRLHQGIVLGLTDPDFSPYFGKLARGEVLESSFAHRLLTRARWLFPRLTGARVNRLVDRLLARRLRNPFPSKVVVAISKALKPHMLCASDATVVTLADSWDHSVGVPQGYVSDLVVGWNADLCSDWDRDQGWSSSMVGFPMRLRYAYEADLSQGDPSVWLYPFGSFPWSRLADWFAEELRIADVICRAASAVGAQVFVKPHPGGDPGHLDDFARAHKNVLVGAYGTRVGGGGAAYLLGGEYDRLRIQEMARCGVVLNLFTTFGLDAAIANRPVCQLDLRVATGFSAIRHALSGHHLHRYLFGVAPDAVMRVNDEDALFGKLASFVKSEQPRRYTDRLRDWLIPQAPQDAVRSVAEHLVALGAGA